jgi:hypothetical protein
MHVRLIKASDSVARREGAEILRDAHQLVRVGSQRLDQLSLGSVEGGGNNVGDDLCPVCGVSTAVRGAEEDLELLLVSGGFWHNG